MSDLTHWQGRPRPSREPLQGRFVLVEPMTDERRIPELWEAFRGHDRLWDYLLHGPFETRAEFDRFGVKTYLGDDPLFHAIVPAGGERALGVMSLMRLDPANGVGEIGHICLSPQLQQTRAATESYRLLFGRVFDELGYRRLEWKCDNRNAPSRRAAERLGFTFEGLFRQHMVARGHNRDTAWFSIIDSEWPRLRDGFDRWLRDENFDENGRQRRSLAQCRG